MPLRFNIARMQPPPDRRSVGIFQLIVLVLSIYGLLALLVDTIFTLKPEASRLIQLFDNAICAVFFWDFIRQFRQADDKMKFMRLGWIDLLACIPTIDLLRWGRLARVLRIFRVLRAVRGTHKVFQALKSRRAMGGSLGLAAFMLVVLSSLLILSCETSDRSNIKTAGDALWWTVTTMTTVGYGDLYPVTVAGRIVAGVLMVAGVGMFGSLTALIAASLSSAPPQENVTEELKALRLEVAELRADLSQHPSEPKVSRVML